MKYFFIIGLTLLFAISAKANTVERIVEGAYHEIRNETEYNTEMLDKYFPPTYKNGKDTGKSVYPNGDVNPKEGICADLVVRALRNAGIDLQKSVHLDILANKKVYGVKTPDKYIDQRRVWILKTYFRRHWNSLSIKLEDPNNWQPGDVVIWDIGSNRLQRTSQWSKPVFAKRKLPSSLKLRRDKSVFVWTTTGQVRLRWNYDGTRRRGTAAWRQWFYVKTSPACKLCGPLLTSKVISKNFHKAYYDKSYWYRWIWSTKGWWIGRT